MNFTLSDIKDATLIITSFSTVLISILTIRKWKAEYKGKAYFDAAIKFKKTVYNLRDNFNSLRSGITTPDEMHPEHNPREEQKREHEAFVINNRLKVFNEALSEFYNIRPEMEAYFCEPAKEICQNINGIIGLYRGAVNEYLQLIGNKNNFDHFASVRKQVYNSEQNDPMKDKMEKEVKNIENLVEKYTHFKTN